MGVNVDVIEAPVSCVVEDLHGSTDINVGGAMAEQLISRTFVRRPAWNFLRVMLIFFH
jgi:hypothetical protein